MERKSQLGLAERQSADDEIRDVSDAEVAELVRSMDKRGVAVLENYVGPEALAGMERLVRAAVQTNAGQYAGFDGVEALNRSVFASSFIMDLAKRERFRDLLERVHHHATGATARASSVYQVMRCLSGETGEAHNYYFHYDSYVVTALLPIIIPTSGRQGHLVMIPNLRKIRPFYIFNLLEKMVLERPFIQRLLRMALERGWMRFLRVEMTPGNLYLFWGYRSLHANEACDIENIRATSLFHLGDPHVTSKLRQRLGRAATSQSDETVTAGA